MIMCVKYRSERKRISRFIEFQHTMFIAMN